MVDRSNIWFWFREINFSSLTENTDLVQYSFSARRQFFHVEFIVDLLIKGYLGLYSKDIEFKILETLAS